MPRAPHKMFQLWDPHFLHCNKGVSTNRYIHLSSPESSHIEREAQGWVWLEHKWKSGESVIDLNNFSTGWRKKSFLSLMSLAAHTKGY